MKETSSPQHPLVTDVIMSRLHYALSRISVVFVTFSASFLSHWFPPCYSRLYLQSIYFSLFFCPFERGYSFANSILCFLLFHLCSFLFIKNFNKKERKSGVVCRTLSRLANSLKKYGRRRQYKQSDWKRTLKCSAGRFFSEEKYDASFPVSGSTNTEMLLQFTN